MHAHAGRTAVATRARVNLRILSVVHLNGVFCVGTEDNINDCPQIRRISQGCSIYTGAGVICPDGN